MGPVSLENIADAAQFAWRVYQIGWGDGLAAGQQSFNELGNDIKQLYENLNKLQGVVNDENNGWEEEVRFPGTSTQKEWDLSSIQDIVGDFGATISDCQKLLEDNPEIRINKGVKHTFRWNIVLVPKIEKLQKRLKAHNAKIEVLLGTLDLPQEAPQVKGLIIPDVKIEMSEQEESKDIPLKVPEDIAWKFLAAAETLHPEVRHRDQFPLQQGADAFFVHFENSTKGFKASNVLKEQTPKPEQYLNLLKCIWILKRIEASESFMEESSPLKDSQWPGYISQLHDNLYGECQRFSNSSVQRLMENKMEMPFEKSAYDIWTEEDIARYISPHVKNLPAQILQIPLPVPKQNLQRQMTIHRVNETRYVIIETVSDINSPIKQKHQLEIDIDLRTFSFIPLYAIPSSSKKPLEIILDSGILQVTPEFQDIKHIYRLQSLLTGYKVYGRYDQPMVKVSAVISGQSEAIEEHGRLQLWLEDLSTNSVETASQIFSEFTGMETMASSSNHQNGQGANRSNSVGDHSISNSPPHSLNLHQSLQPVVWRDTNLTSLSGSTQTSLSPERTYSYPNPNASTPSVARSGRTNSTAVTSVSRKTESTVKNIKTGKSTTAQLHSKPNNPMLVIYLKNKEIPTKLSIVAIQIDYDTNIKRERCDCRSSSSHCRISCIEREKGTLLAQRWDANELSDWNLAQLGMQQRKDSNNRWNNLKRVSIKFEKWEDRYRFAGSPCNCKIKTAHDLSACNLASHNGVYGILKQIGTQRLQNFHDDRERNSSIVIGRLPDVK